MSGIAGFVNFDGAPADLELAGAMADALAFRGPHGREVWCRDSAALVHTLLKTTFEAELERQPASIDGKVWITADARIDGRDYLVRELGLPEATLTGPDCELILQAYARWGEHCVEHLIGDFAFAIWDGRERKLYCARDHFGVKPFYYAQAGGSFIFSNTLNCVRMHPDVGDDLNQLAIADFLVFDYNQDPATTTFRDIQRLPAAHTLIATSRGVTVRRYWSLPEGESIRYRRTRDYVEHFSSLLETAVADRLRTKRVGITMSGGLDSPSVAAFARKVSPQTEIQAYTWFFDSLIPDDERHFAGLVGEYLRIPIEYMPVDGARPFAYVSYAAPEPLHNPIWGFEFGYRRRIAANTSVALTGDGADVLLSISPMVNRTCLRAVPIRSAVVGIMRYSIEFRAVPKFRLRSTLRHLLRRPATETIEVPRWLDPQFAQRCGLERGTLAYSYTVPKDEIRPIARRGLRSGYWPWQFELADAAWFGAPVESRHPYFDTRLARYLLAVPELPYMIDKYLLRLSMRSLLPEPVRTRPKTPLRIDPFRPAVKRYGLDIPQQITDDRLGSFINSAAIPVLKPEMSSEQLWMHTRPISLSNWLKSQEKVHLWKTNSARTSEMHTTHQR